MSSKYTKQDVHFSPARTRSIILWKVPGAEHRPKGITRNWYNPSGVVNAVFGLS